MPEPAPHHHDVGNDPADDWLARLPNPKRTAFLDVTQLDRYREAKREARRCWQEYQQNGHLDPAGLAKAYTDAGDRAAALADSILIEAGLDD